MKTPSMLSDYASETEISQAAAELAARSETLSAELRKARAEARQIHPLFDFRARSRSGKAVARTMKLALPPEAQQIVNRAEQLGEHRDSLKRAAEYLTRVLRRLVSAAGTHLADDTQGGLRRRERRLHEARKLWQRQCRQWMNQKRAKEVAADAEFKAAIRQLRRSSIASGTAFAAIDRVLASARSRRDVG